MAVGSHCVPYQTGKVGCVSTKKQHIVSVASSHDLTNQVLLQGSLACLLEEHTAVWQRASQNGFVSQGMFGRLTADCQERPHI